MNVVRSGTVVLVTLVTEKLLRRYAASREILVGTLVDAAYRRGVADGLSSEPRTPCS